MGTEIELNAGIAKLKADLSELTSAVKSLVDAAIGANEKEQARSAIKADIRLPLRYVRFVPKTDICTATNFLIRSSAPSVGVEVVPVLNEVNANKA